MKKSTRQSFCHTHSFWLFVLPSLALFAVFFMVPLILSIEHAGRRQNRCTDDTDKVIFFKRLIMKQFLHFLSPLFHQIPVNCRYLYDLTDILRVSVNSSLFKHTLLRILYHRLQPSSMAHKCIHKNLT